MNKKEFSTELPPNEVKGFSRRNFLGLTGGLLAAGALLNASCNNDDDDRSPAPGITLTNDDIGILNYYFALEQVGAAFYTMLVNKGFYANATNSEKALLTDIRDHEIAHREFWKSTVGTKAIQALTFDFNVVDFTSRDSVLTHARLLKDLTVAGYNGIASQFRTPANLVLAAKIMSVEARHAAYIRDLLANGSFAGNDVVDSNGLEMSKKPSIVVTAVNSYLKVKLICKLP